MAGLLIDLDKLAETGGAELGLGGREVAAIRTTIAAWCPCQSAARTPPCSASSTWSRAFVEDGFQLPESKSSIAWRDLDSVFLGPAFTPRPGH
jgi:prolyl oligopeptidase PreP (S9A serine peptidase family)